MSRRCIICSLRFFFTQKTAFLPYIFVVLDLNGITVMRKPILLVLMLFAIGSQALSQGIRGEIRDLEGEPVPFASIFIKELTRGTTCNGLGFPFPFQKEPITSTSEAWGTPKSQNQLISVRST